MDESFQQAFAEVIRERVTRRQEVKIEGLGAFAFRHHKQFQQQFKDGRVVMMPPKDTIAFTPDKNVEV